jgi:uncharacterized protein (DUF1330 family)
MENTMKRSVTLGLTLLAGVATGAAAVNELNAQNKAPGAYVVVDLSEINNPELFKTLLPKAEPASAAFGGKFVIRTENIVGLDGTPPKRFVVIAFDSVDKAKAWDASAAQKEITDIRQRSTKSRQFIVDGTIQ